MNMDSETLRRVIADVVRAEREACAAICDAKFKQLAARLEATSDPIERAVYERAATTAAEIESNINARNNATGGE